MFKIISYFYFVFISSRGWPLVNVTNKRLYLVFVAHCVKVPRGNFELARLLKMLAVFGVPGIQIIAKILSLYYRY